MQPFPVCCVSAPVAGSRRKNDRLETAVELIRPGPVSSGANAKSTVTVTPVASLQPKFPSSCRHSTFVRSPLAGSRP